MKIYCIHHTGKGADFRFRENDPRLRDTDATTLAAQIVARREFGKNGIVRTMREDSRAADGSSYTSEAFIGAYDRRNNCTTGHNIWLTETFDTTETYEDKVRAFNKAAGTSYSAAVHFLKFRKTSRGILVGWTVGKPDEIRRLRTAVATAGEPYYMKG